MLIELGKVVGVWGLKGWIKLHSYSRNRADIAHYQNWWLKSKQSDEPKLFEQLVCREQGQGVVAQLKGVDDRDQALALNGHMILIQETDLPVLPENEFYWQQLIGLLVFNSEQEIGRIESILETGANDVLVVKRKQMSDALIPYIGEVVKTVDLKAGTMQVDWDPSLLD